MLYIKLSVSLRVARASGEEQTDVAEKGLVKIRQESEPAWMATAVKRRIMGEKLRGNRIAPFKKLCMWL